MKLFDHELHLHLYGCLTADILWQLAKSKTNIDWVLFESEYFNEFGVKLDMASLFEENSEINRKRFEEIYIINHAGPFSQFLAKFNLIETIVDLTDTDEIKQVIDYVCNKHIVQGLIHAEYRILFPLPMDEQNFYEVLAAACHQLHEIELRTNSQFQGRLSLSIPRELGGEKFYFWLRKAMRENAIIAQIVTSIDFCNKEEGYPPKNKQALFQQVLSDNLDNLNHSLAILYHVGESFQDKSLESAIRWVHEAGQFGAHRLGHAIALGTPPKLFLGRSVQETVSERLDQIAYDLEHSQGLEQFGIKIDKDHLLKEKLEFEQASHERIIKRTYQENDINDLEQRQKYAISCLRKMNICIEVCPTSNLIIGKVNDPNHHSLVTFIKEELPFIVSSDDPGIFNTTLMNEINWLKANVTNDKAIMKNLIVNAQKFRSESISGRWSSERRKKWFIIQAASFN